jgi:putative addiction module component (TIGR02574 family)
LCVNEGSEKYGINFVRILARAMSYNKEELLALSPEDKIALAEELWGSVENELLPITDEDLAFAEERLKLHEASPNEHVSLEGFKSHFAKKYGF